MSLRLIADNVVKSYNGKPILRGCSCDLQPGNTYALMGPNGCGKSTFLRICALLEQQDGGAVRYVAGDAEQPQDLALRRRITLVLPKVGVFNTTVMKNAAYGLGVRGIGGDDARKQAEGALAFVGMAHLKDQHALTLSSGETQRLGIARALAVNPEILFLDEPTASVDSENTGIIEGIINRLKQEHGRTVIITTHDREQADRIADRILVVEDGRLCMLA